MNPDYLIKIFFSIVILFSVYQMGGGRTLTRSRRCCIALCIRVDVNDERVKKVIIKTDERVD